jgi:hypothetical protein
MVLFRDESIREKKVMIYDHMFNLHRSYKIEKVTWSRVDSLPDCLVSNIIGLCETPKFIHSYVNVDDNMFDSVGLDVSKDLLSGMKFDYIYEYYVLYSMDDYFIKLVKFDGAETNKYFNNYIIKKRDGIINEILKDK